MIKPPKNILYLAPSSAHGGAETFLLHTAKFHLRDYKPFYLCFHEGPLVKSLRETGHVTLILSHPPRLRNPAQVWRTIREIYLLVKEHKIDLVHSTMAYGAIFGGVAAALAFRKHVWFQHGPVGSWLDRIASYLPSRAILVNSNFTEMSQRKINSRSSFRRINLGVDTDRAALARRDGHARSMWRRAWNIPEETFLVGTVCRPQPQKGLADFVLALKRLQQNQTVPVLGIVIGGSPIPGEYEKEILRLIDSHQAPVRIFPASGQVLEQLPALDLLVSAAVKPEAFGLTLIEAMSLGIPALAPGEGGPREIIIHGKDGFLFQPRSVESLAEAMEEVIRLTPEYRIRLGEAAEASVAQKFSARSSVAELENYYRDL